MSRVRALVEGRTELIFVQEMLAPALLAEGVYVSATMLGKPGRRGGIRRWETLRRDIEHALKGDPACTITTLLDYYGLPVDWHGRVRHPAASEEATAIERRMATDIRAALGPSFDDRRFIPYVQVYEFEALLFAGPESIADALGNPELADPLRRIVDECGEPERINDGPATSPSKRIIALAPSYQKVRHGSLAAMRIGLAAMRQASPLLTGGLLAWWRLRTPREAPTSFRGPSLIGHHRASNNAAHPTLPHNFRPSRNRPPASLGHRRR
ncbi:MAG: DUF4276 family protein [Phycisphaerales bacterium]|nr:MAG: DUF4276 family protein [Phycisphaerales bacterium]